MNLATALVLLLLLALAVLAVRRIRKKRLLFSCGGDCSACAVGCSRRPPPGEKGHAPD